MRYTVETLSRKQLRKCYSRYGLTMLLYLIASQALAVGLVMLIQRYLPPYLASDVWYPVLSASVNAISAYLPGLVLVPLLMHKFPRATKLPVDRMTLEELMQAALFSMGTVYLFAMLTGPLIWLLSMLSGMDLANVVAQASENQPAGLLFLFSVVIAPVCEELIFRKLLLNPLRVLGDGWAVVLSALAFSLFHMNLFQTFYAFAIGLVFACIVLITGSIRDTILLHMFINGFNLFIPSAGPDYIMVLPGVFYLICVISIPVLLWQNHRAYTLESGPLPFRPREKRLACLRSVWFWLMLLFGLGGSILTPFMVA